MVGTMAIAMALLLVLLVTPALAKSVKNPADALASTVNKNLTSSKLPKLHINPGLACIALQYIQAYEGECDEVGPGGKRPPPDALSTTFAANCGVDSSSISNITGIVLACETMYRDANYAFANLLFKEATSLQKLQYRNQTEFGVGISGYEGGGPYFWCLLFSNADPATSFEFLDKKAKKAKFQKTGCFSGTGEACSGAKAATGSSLGVLMLGLVLTAAFLG